MSADPKTYPLNKGSNKFIKELYETYAKKLLGYTLKNYGISEDDAWTVVYKTIYKMADVKDRYTFDHENKRSAFIFKMHINFLRNFFRDNRSFESKLYEVEIDDRIAANDEPAAPESPEMKILQNELDKLEEWQRILLLMRGQDVPYSEIATFVSKPEDQLKVYYARLKKVLLENITAQLQKLNITDNATK
jgi:DNA-directed RNA polymerase specialized sigma24 family protein